jgi:probable F420-dependent oxidoreductase
MARPFRFGYQTYTAPTAQEWRDKARRAEELGFGCFTVADHYLGPGPALEAMRHPAQDVAAVPAMAVAAEATSTIRIGPRVMCVDYRNPVVLAKEMATLDFFSDGRLEIGLGAGWLKGEYESMGIPFDPPGTRIDRLGDVVAMMRAVFAGGQPDYEGDSGVRATGFAGTPPVVQQPSPPIMIGGGGKKVLRLAGRVADIVSFNFNNRGGMIGPDSLGTSTAAATEEKLSWVREGAGDRFDDIELEIAAYFTVVTDDTKGTLDNFSKMFGLSAEELAEHPHVLIGSVDAIVDQLGERRDHYGISYTTVSDRVAESFAPVVEQLTGK